MDQVKKSHLNSGCYSTVGRIKMIFKKWQFSPQRGLGRWRLERFGGKIIELCFKVSLGVQKTILKLPSGFRLSLCWEGDTSAVTSGASERSQPSELPVFSTAGKWWQIRWDLQRKKCRWSAVMEVITIFLLDTQTGFHTHLTSLGKEMLLTWTH